MNRGEEREGRSGRGGGERQYGLANVICTHSLPHTARVHVACICLHSPVIQSGTAAWTTQCPEPLQCHPGTKRATAEVGGEVAQSEVVTQKHITQANSSHAQLELTLQLSVRESYT